MEDMEEFYALYDKYNEWISKYWDHVDQKTVFVRVKYPDCKTGKELTSVGSGVVVFDENNHTIVLTCGHTLESYFKLGVGDVKVFVDYFYGASVVANVVSTRHHARREIGVLHTYVPGAPKLPVAGVAKRITKGMKVFMGGHTYGFNRIAHTGGSLSHHSVHGELISHEDLPSIMEFDGLNAGRGASGSAILDHYGDLIAILFAGKAVECGGEYEGKITYLGELKYGHSVNTMIHALNEICDAYVVPSDPLFTRRLAQLVQKLPSTPTVFPASLAESEQFGAHISLEMVEENPRDVGHEMDRLCTFYGDESLPCLYESTFISSDQILGHEGFVRQAASLGWNPRTPLVMIANLCGLCRVELIWRFTSVLEPRKAAILERSIGKVGAVVTSKDVLAAGFLSSGCSALVVNASQFVDALSDTRIHPEPYDLAWEMAKDMSRKIDKDDNLDKDIEMTYGNLSHRSSALKSFKACKALDESWRHKLAIIVYSNYHRMKSFQFGSPNVPPVTVIEDKVYHQGTSKLAEYHLLLDVTRFSSDEVVSSICLPSIYHYRASVLFQLPKMEIFDFFYMPLLGGKNRGSIRSGASELQFRQVHSIEHEQILEALFHEMNINAHEVLDESWCPKFTIIAESWCPKFTIIAAQKLIYTEFFILRNSGNVPLGTLIDNEVYHHLYYDLRMCSLEELLVMSCRCSLSIYYRVCLLHQPQEVEIKDSFCKTLPGDNYGSIILEHLEDLSRSSSQVKPLEVTVFSQNMLELLHNVDQSKEQTAASHLNSSDYNGASDFPAVGHAPPSQSQFSTSLGFSLQLAPPSQGVLNHNEAAQSSSKTVDSPNIGYIASEKGDITHAWLPPVSSSQSLPPSCQPIQMECGNEPGSVGIMNADVSVPRNLSAPLSSSYMRNSLQNQHFTAPGGKSASDQSATTPLNRHACDNQQLSNSQPQATTSHPVNNSHDSLGSGRDMNQSGMRALVHQTPASLRAVMSGMSRKDNLSPLGSNIWTSQQQLLGAQAGTAPEVRSQFQSPDAPDTSFTQWKKDEQDSAKRVDALSSQGIVGVESQAADVRSTMKAAGTFREEDPSARQLSSASPSNSAVSQKDIESFNYFVKPNNNFNSYSLLHQMQAIKSMGTDPSHCESKTLKGQDGLDPQHIAGQATEPAAGGVDGMTRDPSMSQTSVSAGDAKVLSFSPHLGNRNPSLQLQHGNVVSQDMLSFGRSDPRKFAAGNFTGRNEHTGISPQMAPSWFEQYGTFKNGQLLPGHYAPRIPMVKTAKQQFNSGISPSNLVVNNSVQLSTAVTESGQVANTCQTAYVYTPTEHVSSLQALVPHVPTPSSVSMRPKKRNTSTSDLLPWNKEIGQSLKRLQNKRDGANDMQVLQVISIHSIEYKHLLQGTSKLAECHLLLDVTGFSSDEVVSSICLPSIYHYRASVHFQLPKMEIFDFFCKPLLGGQGRGSNRSGASELQFKQVHSIKYEQILKVLFHEIDIHAHKVCDESWRPKFTIIAAQKLIYTEFFILRISGNVPLGTLIDNEVYHHLYYDLRMCSLEELIVMRCRCSLSMYYRVCLLHQPPNVEMKDSFCKTLRGGNYGAIIREHLEDLSRSSSQVKPLEVTVSRDGANESQVLQVISIHNIEYKHFFQAYKALDGCWSSKFTIFVVQKIHMTKFFQLGSPGNVQQGTVIDGKVATLCIMILTVHTQGCLVQVGKLTIMCCWRSLVFHRWKCKRWSNLYPLRLQLQEEPWCYNNMYANQDFTFAEVL